MAKKKNNKDLELLLTLGDFTSKDNWDKFFTLRGSEEPFEWYVEWSNLRDPLLSQLSEIQTDTLQILVPGCGNSQISESLYDAGFRNVTNIDFSKVVVSDMLRRHIRSRPEMRWRVMDMTNMQVKRVLKFGGKFVCLTLAESHVLGLLFSKFRFGWKMTLHAIPHNPSNIPSFQTFMAVVAKESSCLLHPIISSFDQSSLDCNGNQGHGVLKVLEAENKLRTEYSSDADIIYSFEDLQLGAKGDLKELIPGRRVRLTLGEQGMSCFSYKAVLLDAQKQSQQFVYHCGVFLVPKIRAHEWLFSSEEGQWLVVEMSKAARLIMVFLDAIHTDASMEEIQKDLSPHIRSLAPGKSDDRAQIPFMMANNGEKEQTVVKQVTSTTTGNIIVNDVIYENVDDHGGGHVPAEDFVLRCLIFERSLGLLQSEAVLARKEYSQNNLETERKKTSSSSKSRRNGNRRGNDSRSSPIDGSRNNLKVDHSYLASSYHCGIVSGFALIATKLEMAASAGKTVKTAVIGLGAGLLPMFIHGCMPFLDIEVVELDPIVLDLAKDYFGFVEDNQLKVHIADGIQFVREATADMTSSRLTSKNENDVISKESSSSPNTSGTNSLSQGKKSTGFEILIIDADSADLSSGLTCPPADFMEESFLLTVKESLSEGGLFIINLVSRSAAIREMVVSRMKVVFNHLFCLELVEDVNKVLFALHTELSVKQDCLFDSAVQLQKLLKFEHPERGLNIIETANKLKCLK
ncbi:S-adenosyl-L-methionine-dependent methyltransferases superfamily protein isoform X2 [Tasmannia lanceolata]|uniref:S-adenosyl-L-methionine-dependent methyltransferases superfamily protein isoform X2 n=1 Tax=Tasmannia lanceolata TaxID=3420 RepID=UPI004064735C